MTPQRANIPGVGPVVYYIQRTGLIKIGFTTCLADRMNALRPDQLLAVEVGDRDLEYARHEQFAAHRVRTPAGTEWFRPAPNLLAHIAVVVQTQGEPWIPPTDPDRPRRKSGPVLAMEELRLGTFCPSCVDVHRPSRHCRPTAPRRSTD